MPFFFFNDTATTEIYTLSLHDALPIYHEDGGPRSGGRRTQDRPGSHRRGQGQKALDQPEAHKLLVERVRLRRDKDFEAADAIRERLRAGGWEVVASAEGSELKPLNAPPGTTPPPTAPARSPL